MIFPHAAPAPPQRSANNIKGKRLALAARPRALHSAKTSTPLPTLLRQNRAPNERAACVVIGIEPVLTARSSDASPKPKACRGFSIEGTATHHHRQRFPQSARIRPSGPAESRENLLHRGNSSVSTKCRRERHHLPASAPPHRRKPTTSSSPLGATPASAKPSEPPAPKPFARAAPHKRGGERASCQVSPRVPEVVERHKPQRSSPSQPTKETSRRRPHHLEEKAFVKLSRNRKNQNSSTSLTPELPEKVRALLHGHVIPFSSSAGGVRHSSSRRRFPWPSFSHGQKRDRQSNRAGPSITATANPKPPAQ